MRKLTKDFVALLSQFLANMNQHKAILGIHVDPMDEEVEVVYIPDMAMGVEVGVPLPVRSIAGQKTCPGYRVLYSKTHAATRWDPPEEEDITVRECVSPVVACGALGAAWSEFMAINAGESLGELPGA